MAPLVRMGVPIVGMTANHAVVDSRRIEKK
jgi:hypothetical protein